METFRQGICSMIRVLKSIGVMGLCLCFVVPVSADCPSADLTGDCFVDLEDFSVLAEQWLTAYDSIDLAAMASEWQSGSRISADMVLIPGGMFQMGAGPDGFSSALPVHTVTLSPFYMSKYHVTNGQYRDFLQSAYDSGAVYVSSGRIYGTGNNQPYCDTSQINWNGSTFSVRTKGVRSMVNDPMQLSWYGAVAYANWRSAQEGKQPCYNLSTWVCDFSKKGYRLPTEAQWEYAARGGLAGKRFPWGDTITHTHANYWSSSLYYSYDISPTRGYHPTWFDGTQPFPYTSPVGSFPPNGYGLYDMAGNLFDWCNDWYSGYTSTSKTNPTGPTTGSQRVLRGGNWWDTANECRVNYRHSFNPTAHYGEGTYGFRVSLDY